jgi:hypothetical protein
MSLSRAIVSIASIFFAVSAAVAQQPETTTAPPVFQGLMVDAKGKIVGRVFIDYEIGVNTVVRQISGAWEKLAFGDPASGFNVLDISKDTLTL